MSAADSSSRAPFPTTAWSFIQAVQAREHPEHVAAVNRFITLYWKPVFYFLRTRGMTFHDAQDVTQAFFMRLLEKDVVERADRERGRFRTFLLAVLSHFVADLGPARAGRQKAFERRFLSVESLMGDVERCFEPAGGESAEDVFNRQWAAAVWHNVMEQLREHYAAEERAEWFDIFLAYFAPADKRPSQDALAAAHRRSRDQVRDILKKVEQRFERLLRAEIREQTRSEADIDQEIGDLKKYFARFRL